MAENLLVGDKTSSVLNNQLEISRGTLKHHDGYDNVSCEN